MDLSFLPLVNATLNGLATLLLILGFILIKQRRIDAHRNVMITAFGVSCLFLALYLTHKIWRATAGGPMHTEYHGSPLMKRVYLTILLTHLVLAMTVPVLVIRLIFLGLRQRFDAHRRLAKYAFPIWLYVSITGVVIYLMLYPFNPVG